MLKFSLLAIAFAFFINISCNRPAAVSSSPPGVTIPQMENLPPPPEISPAGTDTSVNLAEPQKFEPKDKIYLPNIHTVMFHDEGMEVLYPIIDLQNPSPLQLVFDDLEADVKTYHYSLELYNADWTPSGLSSFEYLDGFSESFVNEYHYSVNTLQRYTQYRIDLPNSDIRFTKAGNYLLKVYLNNDPENLAFTKRLLVVNTKVEIDGQVRVPSNPRLTRTHQEINFNIKHPHLEIQNPFQEISVSILQNGIWETELSNIKPLFIRDKLLQYNYEGKLIFPALREFRYFDIRSFRLLSERVKRIEPGRLNDIILADDPIRSYESYRYYRDNNGRRLIGAHDGRNSILEADYARVHFSLQSNSPVTNGDLFVAGPFTSWENTQQNMLQYNRERKTYDGSLILKQGYYNYLYGYLENGIDEKNFTFIEGSSYEAENEYLILVYHRSFGSRYDELIAISLLNSRR